MIWNILLLGLEKSNITWATSR